LRHVEKSNTEEWKMLKNLKLLIMVLVIVLIFFSVSFSADRTITREVKNQPENLPVAKEIVIPKDTSSALQDYNIPWSVLNGGGTDMTSTSYKAMVSTAQSVIGESQSTNYQMKIGYWYGGKPFVCGDINGTGNVDIADIVYLVAYFFKLGPQPDPLYCADTNGDSSVNVADIVYLVVFLFKHGPAPHC
jgi:hypothetical protein